MDLTLLRSLLAVAEAGTITGAAQRLNLTQPALSRRIHQLEEHLGATLLTRGRKGVILTPIGELVLPEARILAERYDHLRAEVAAHARLEGGTVRIGGGATAVSFVLPGAIAAYQLDHPSVRFEVKESGSREITENVIDGRLELGLVTLPVTLRGVEQRPLVEDQIVLICARDHPLAKARNIDITRLAGLGLVGFEAGSAIRQLVDNALRDAGVEMNVVMELRSIPAIVRMVMTTGNLAFVSQMGVASESGVRALQVQGLSIRRELAVITRAGAELSPAAASFATQLNTHGRKL
jgi:DNA-binding transcriptional LysR family regulator